MFKVVAPPDLTTVVGQPSNFLGKVVAAADEASNKVVVGSSTFKVVANSDGAPGPKGDQGERGLTGASLDFVFTQASPASVWDVVHDLGVWPVITVLSTAGETLTPAVHHIDTNHFTLTFGAPQDGLVRCV